MTDTMAQVWAILVAGHVNQLWDQWQNSEEGGCCNQCCGPCWALKELLDRGALDGYYAAYLKDAGGGSDVWDEKNQQIDRKFLTEAWAVDRGCSDAHDELEKS